MKQNDKEQATITADYESVLKIVQDFKSLLRELPLIIEACSTEINEDDKAFGDIRHFCELNYPLSRVQKTKVCRLMREYSERRRQAKDWIAFLTPLNEARTNNRPYFGLNEAVNKMQNEYRRINSERIYRPRVLTELFAENGEEKG